MDGRAKPRDPEGLVSRRVDRSICLEGVDVSLINSSRDLLIDYPFSEPNMGSLFLVRRKAAYPVLGIAGRSVRCPVARLRVREWGNSSRSVNFFSSYHCAGVRLFMTATRPMNSHSISRAFRIT